MQEIHDNSLSAASPVSDKPLFTLAGGKRRPGRPSRDISSLIGSVHGQLTILGRAKVGLAGRQAGRALSDRYIWVRVSCDCGRYTSQHPKIVRLDHVLQTGPDKTVSCGCVGLKRYKQNGEAVVAKMKPALVRAVFAAFVRCPWKSFEIARQFSLAFSWIGHIYRYVRDRIIAGLETLAKLPRRLLSKWTTYPSTPLEITADDLAEVDIPWMSAAFA